MPTRLTVGVPGENNRRIGGEPVIHYLDYQSRGRGQVLRLLCEDAAISYVDVRYAFGEVPKAKESKLAEMNPVKKLPIVELNGEILTQSYAILRHFARLLGAYEGDDEEEQYWTDAMCDIATDWRTLFVQAFFSPDMSRTYPTHQRGDQALYLSALETHLASNRLSRSGPFVLGSRISYVDFVIYQICHDEGLTRHKRRGLANHPRMARLVDGVEARPNVKAFLKSDRYLG